MTSTGNSMYKGDILGKNLWTRLRCIDESCERDYSFIIHKHIILKKKNLKHVYTYVDRGRFELIFTCNR